MRGATATTRATPGKHHELKRPTLACVPSLCPLPLWTHRPSPAAHTPQRRTDAYGLITKTDAKRLHLVTDGQLKKIRCLTKSWYKGKKYLYLTRTVQRLAATRHRNQATFKKVKATRKVKPKGHMDFFMRGWGGYGW